MIDEESSNDQNLLRTQIEDLLKSNALGELDDLIRIKGRGNNQVYRVLIKNKNYLLKRYFSHPNDPRNRLNHEFLFCKYAERIGLKNLPLAYVKDEELNLGLYEFLEGRPIRIEDLDEDFILELPRFISDLNSGRDLEEAKRLPLGSEAYFSIAEHLSGIGERVARLQHISTESNVEKETKDFLESEFTPFWEKLQLEIRTNAEKAGLLVNKTLETEQTIISPSDFGFHNALLSPERGLCFYDFEYGGWDDPAKLIADLFCQVAFPLDLVFLEKFCARLTFLGKVLEEIRKRAIVLLPAYRIKWCCIVLNHFLPTGQSRRSFAENSQTVQTQKMLQLEKARRLFNDLPETMTFLDTL